MNLNKSDHRAIWSRFDELAVMSDEAREKAWHSDGMAFVASLLDVFMTDNELPEIDTAEEFSDFIVESRRNYRLWNKRLMSLMIAFDAEPTLSRADDLREFVTACPWKELIEAADNFVTSKS